MLVCFSITANAADNSTSRWIILYKNGKSKTTMQAVGKIRHSYQIIPGYAADLTAAEVDKLRKDPSIATVEPDHIRHKCEIAPVSSTQPYDAFLTSTTGQVIPYGIDLVHARDAWPITKGAGARVAMIDTGIDFNNPDIGHVIASKSFVAGVSVQDTDGHGTHTSGTVAAQDNNIGVVGVAPGADLLIAQVFDSSGNAYDSDIAAAIDWAVSNGANVISMSLGGPDSDTTLQQACANAVAAGVTVVAAAGNDNSSTPSYPASYPSVISVTAIDSNKQRASFSNYGSTSSLAAPGVDVLSTVIVGTGTQTASAIWNGITRTADPMTGSANGTVTAPAIYCGLGNPSDFPSSVRGNIAHIRRGTLTFADKVKNAIAAGAAGVIISNNTSGTISGTLNGTTSVVVVAVSQTDGDDLQARSGISASITNASADYDLMSGTSMATPHVSGVAALLYSARHGSISPTEVRNAMQNSAEDLGTTGWDQYFGYGLVNAAAAIRQVIPTISAVSISPAYAEPGDPIHITAVLSTNTGVSSIKANGYTLSSTGGTWQANIPADPNHGTHTVDVALTDSWGNVSHNTNVSYKSAWVVGTNGRDLHDRIATGAVGTFDFVVYGQASQVTTNSFVLSDGSGYPITITATGHTVKNGNFVRVKGPLQTGASSPTIQTTAAKISLLK